MLPRVVSTVVLLFLLAACGGGGPDEEDAAALPSAATTSAGPAEEPADDPTDAPATTSTASGGTAEPVSGEGMPAGCDALNRAFAALDEGDDALAQSYADTAEQLFDDVAALAATDVDLATDGATLASDLGFVLDENSADGFLGTDYTEICVGRYGAPPL